MAQINSFWLPVFCQVECLNRTSFALPGRLDIKYIEISAASFSDPTFSAGMFDEVPNIEWYEGHGIGTTDLEDGLFGTSSRLIFMG